eukprot:GFYU01000234.1.p1 GENE.GFYU01000234.1~~GFYU01000234.1.p1  ORF type:complete len:113 (+),score=17.56 GFYU01000234.1:368-706(+)
MADYQNSCECGTRYENNCAHFLSNWMIRRGKLSPRPSDSTYNCPAGRPLRAKDMRDVFKSLGLESHFNPPPGNCYIYCEQGGRGHVFYGKRTELVAGTLSGEKFGEYFEYYF